MYTVRARALNKETETSNKEISLSFTTCYYMVAARKCLNYWEIKIFIWKEEATAKVQLKKLDLNWNNASKFKQSSVEKKYLKKAEKST